MPKLTFDGRINISTMLGVAAAVFTVIAYSHDQDKRIMSNATEIGHVKEDIQEIKKEIKQGSEKTQQKLDRIYELLIKR